jgi:hypothetical protein
LRVGEAERVETVEAVVVESPAAEEGEAVLAVTRALRICSGEGERKEGRQRRTNQERKGKKEKKEGQTHVPPPRLVRSPQAHRLPQQMRRSQQRMEVRAPLSGRDEDHWSGGESREGEGEESVREVQGREGVGVLYASVMVNG